MRALALVCFVALGCSNVAVSKRSHKAELVNNIKELLSGEFQIIDHDHMTNDELCATLRCHRNEVCLKKHGDALCIKRRYVEKYGSQRKPDFVKVVHEKYSDKERKPIADLLKPPPKHERKSTTHRFDPKDKREDCTKDKLEAIGERMLKWFGDIHKEHSAKVNHVPRHTVKCDPEVAWMFGELDGDTDGILSVRELTSVQNDPYERCMKPFIDRCDQDGDDDIDTDEWCDCFSYVNHEEDEPICHKQAHEIDPHDPDTFSPRCNVDGYFKVVQCFKGECWCVDKFGREFDRSRVTGERPDCGQYAEDD